jgi:hypothetical protein
VPSSEELIEVRQGGRYNTIALSAEWKAWLDQPRRRAHNRAEREMISGIPAMT